MNIMNRKGECSVKKACDLHTHSIFSDGSWTPEQLIEESVRIGLAAVALCDHNTVAGLPRFMAAAEGKPVEAVPGIEFSVEYQGTELHMLGLMIRPEHYDAVNGLLDDFLRRKEESNRELIDNLNRAGYHLNFEELKNARPDGYLNRAHIAAELTRQGVTESIQQAFKVLLNPSCGYYNPPKRPDAYETISFIRDLGAVPVWAHPFLNLREEEIRKFLPQAVACGLRGMETIYPRYDPETTQKAAQIADSFGLLPSGGSDFHGTNKPELKLGVGDGNLFVPYEHYCRLVKTW